MRVAEVCIRFDAPGGAEDHVRAISEGLAGRGHDVEVHASDLLSEVPWRRLDDPSTQVDGVRVVRHRAERALPPLLRSPVMPTLEAALRASDADVLHGHSHRYPHLRACARAKGATGKPLVVTPHYHPAEAGLPAWRRAALRLMDQESRLAVYRHADRVLCVTEGEAAILSRLVDPARIRVVPNGIRAKEWTPAPEPAEDRWEGPVWGFAGRLASNKGLPTLLEAFARDRRQRGAGTLVLVGEDWGMAEALEAQAKDLGVAEHVHLLGYVSRERYRRLLARFDVLCLPSEWEAFGIVLLEAWCAGTPVVATRAGGMPWVVEDGADGLLVEVGDAPGLARAAATLLDDPDLAAAYARRGREKTLERFTWTHVVDLVEAAYREVVP